MDAKIYQAIANAMKEISPIAKGKKNKEQGFAYRGVDDVMNELNPILAKYNIFIYPEVIGSQRDERQTKSGGTLLYSILTIKYHFATDDGSEVCTTVVGEGMDSGDKASNKAMAVAFKYACLQMFCIPTSDIKDPDEETPPQLSPNKGQPKQPAPPSPAPPVQTNPLYDQCKAGMNELKNIMLATAGDNSRLFSDGEYNVVKEALNGLIGKRVDEMWSGISKLLDDNKEQLQIRLDDWAKKQKPQQPATTTTGTAKPGKPSLAEEFRKNKEAAAVKNATAEADDGFVDDIPGSEKAELAAAVEQAGELDIF